MKNKFDNLIFTPGVCEEAHKHCVIAEQNLTFCLCVSKRALRNGEKYK
ncbi:MAG: hypothetical protein R3Y47_03470 [Lachnospiraceae bacterium]